MDILSVAGFALNVYSYLQDQVEEPKREMVPEFVMPQQQVNAATLQNERILSPSRQSKQTYTDSYPQQFKSVGVEELLQQAEKKASEADSVVVEAAETSQKPVKKQVPRFHIEKRSGKIVSGVDPVGRYFFKREQVTEHQAN